MWTCFSYLPYFLQPGSFVTQCIDVGSAYTKHAKSTCIGGAYVKGTDTGGAGSVEHSRIDLQSILISEVEIFHID